MTQGKSQTNLWKWVVFAILGGVLTAVVWEYARRTPPAPSSPSPVAFAQTQTNTSGQTKPPQPQTDLRIKGNRASKIYHLPNCASYNRISERNIVWFKTTDEAESAGYRMARNC